MGTPFTFEGTLELPGAPGLPADPLPFAIASSYDSKAEFEFNFPAGAGSQSVDFGTVPSAGAKALLIVYEAKVGAPPVAVTINGGNQAIEVTTGGFIAIGSPNPATGITSVSLAYTGAGRVYAWLLG